MNRAGSTHLEYLIEWRSHAAAPLGTHSLHRRWMSPLLPTRRFGPGAWAAFQTGNEPINAYLGDFCGWVVFDANSVRLLAYLEPPLADRFGVVPHFPKPLNHLHKTILPALGRAGAQFLADAEPGDDANAVRDALRSLDDSYADALRIIAPDFFTWVGV